MKKIFSILVLLFSSMVMMAAISEKYSDGTYLFKSLKCNTGKDEYNMSKFGENSIIYFSRGKLMKVDIDTERGITAKPQVYKELRSLGIHGTVAYDENKGIVYYSVKESDKCEWLYAAKKQGKSWVAERLVIDGMEDARGRSNFLMNAGWNYMEKKFHIMLNPVMAKNGSRIYFTSATLPDGEGGLDIWYIDAKGDGTWTAPVNAGSNINSKYNEDFAFVENDEVIYFSSNRERDVNLYMAKTSGDGWEFAQKMPEPYNSNKLDQAIVVINETPLVVANRVKGRRRDIYAFVKQPEDPEPIPVEEPEVSETEKEYFWTFFIFDFDKDVLTDEFEQELEMLIAEMNKYPDAMFEVRGHTDERGSDTYNDELSLRRAETVKKMLVDRGFNAEKLICIGRGERALKVPNAQTEEEHAENRRVEINIINPTNK